MGWERVSPGYSPAAGEKVRVDVQFGFAGTYSTAAIRAALEASGYSILAVRDRLFRAPFAPAEIEVELLSQAKPISQTAQEVAGVVSESWNIWSATPVGYYKWTEGLIPQPSIHQLVFVVAIALIALAGVYFVRRFS